MNRASRRQAYDSGRHAETLACWLLRLKGYQILARNWRCPAGEIDLVARRGRTLAAIEVKRRPTGALALESIRPYQRRRIERALSVYVSRHPHLATLDWRFDAIAIRAWNWPTHVAGAWRPEAE